MSHDTSGCRTCNKTSLSLIAFRLSLVANDTRLAPAGADQVSVDDALVAGIAPKKKPKKSRYVLRLLREGYLYLYFPKPPEGVKPWRVFRVTRQGDLVPEENDWFQQWGKDVACDEKGHIPMGLKIADIPAADEVKELWVAWSANLWNATVRARCAANPKAMKKIVLGGDNPNTFKPTAENLKGKVLECALPYMSIKGSEEHDFPFTSISGQVDGLVKRLEQAAACSNAKGRQLAVILPDFVGLATEANATRLRRNELAEIEVLNDKDVSYALNSSNIVLGLKQAVIEEVMARRFEAATSIVSGGAFKDSMRAGQQRWPAGSVWQPLPNTKEYRMRYGDGMGIVVTPDYEQRLAATGPWVREQVDRQWKRMRDYYDAPALAAWREQFQKDMKRKHYDELVEYETDWWLNIRQDEGFKNYFALHFDDKDPNDPKRFFSPGRVYVSETKLATEPAPITKDRVLDDYVAELTKPVTDPSAVMLRALVANQAQLVVLLDGVLGLEQATEHMIDKRNDKLYDLGAGFVEAVDPKSPYATMRLLARYSWLTKVSGDLLCGFTFAISQALGGAAMAKVAQLTGAGMAAGRAGDAAQVKRLIHRLTGMQLAQRAGELALQSLVAGHGLKTPILISKRYPLGHAFLLLRERNDIASAHARSAVRDGHITLTFLTDNHELASFQGDIDKAVASGAGTVELPARPTPALLKPSALAATVALSEADYSLLWRRNAGVVARGARMIEEGITHTRAIFGTLDGRLALGAMLINGAGLQGALEALSDQDARKVRDGWVGLIDNTAGVAGGAALGLEVAAASSIAARIGKDAVKRSVGIHELRAVGNFMGTLAGFVNAYGQWARAGDAFEDKEYGVFGAYLLSGFAFAGTGITSGLLTAGALADRQLAKGIANAALRAAAQRMAMRFGAEGTAALLGISVSGWGLILLAFGLVFEVWAVLFSPKPLELWAARTRFGTGKGTHDPKFKDWPEAKAALEKLLESPQAKQDDSDPTGMPDYTAA